MDALRKNRLVIAGLVVALLLVLWAWLRHQRQRSDAPRQTQEQLTAFLGAVERSDVAELRIRRPDDEEDVVLRKQEQGWRLLSPVESDADQSRVDEALKRLAELEVVRVVSENKETHEQLEVAEKNGVHVVAVNEGGESLIDFYVGAVEGNRTVVRRAGEDRSLAVDGSIKFAFNQELRSWRNRQVTDADPATVTSVVFQPREGEAFHFVRKSESEWEPAEGQGAIERFDASKVQNIVSSLSKITATDFAASEVTIESAGLGDTAGRVELRFDAPAEASETESQAGSDQAPQTEDDPAPSSADRAPIVLFASETGPSETQHYLRRDGNDEIYVVSSYHGEKLLVNTESFQEPEPEEPGDGDTPAGL